MSLSTEEVKKISLLARLAISDEEAQHYSDSLSEIFDLVEQMNAVDTTGIEPMAHPQDISQRLREDVVTAIDEREKFQSIAPATEDNLYLVPKVIE
ncbi:MAG TPA: Asp-tRNA(Asn)/Glu-tRNA(Gln) amidotransferase subunit GatC [Leucothrix mucor]|uniref:Aspartyl/glutamyl-tRNA(Asn/Gln) amidotransferase subunit C n=1 Tax=Leucothrix mucor TaxID=45248 RepID=A0A7V2WU92_LEUMU|nr:Asp-tRNA(Asn)/Glu-tRNA(Gln) amidotransferase subunit GatC [Leucothrix mucor]